MSFDAGRAEDMLVSLTHLWFFENVEANRTVKVWIDNILESIIFVAVFLWMSHSLTRFLQIISAKTVELVDRRKAKKVFLALIGNFSDLFTRIKRRSQIFFARFTAYYFRFVKTTPLLEFLIAKLSHEI